MDNIESTLTSNINLLTNNVNNLTSTVNSLAQLMEVQIKNNSNNDNNGSTPMTPTALPKNSPLEKDNIIGQPPNKILEEGPPNIKHFSSIPLAKEERSDINFRESICTADLESIITPEGDNYVYMAAWLNDHTNRIYHISSTVLDQSSFLEQFWRELIEYNKNRTCYFHNFGGYDSILSLPYLLKSLPGLTFKPIIKDGELMSLEVYQGTTKLITIKDSIKILPGSLSKLAKDWKVETLKDHFPHYFWNGSIQTTLRYTGIIPEYKYFEPKRTNIKDYEDMVEIFKNKAWSFLEVSKTYILSDCKALYQVLLRFFETVKEKFPMNPINNVSAPSVAFRIWRTVQLPLIQTSVRDLSNSKWDTYLRQSYNGGIVDVYKFHLKGKGYYYDVNSLYPTAMCEPMPIGNPTVIDPLLWGHNFFGFVDATVRAPTNEYIGLLSIKWQGRLVCPAGTFRGLFFSEELKFALDNGYTIIQIHQLIQFTRGETLSIL